MNTIEIILISLGVFGFFVLLYTLFFHRKKKGKAKEKTQETQKQEVQEPAKEEKTPFKIIRKKSNVKIHKKALTSGSRNPSVTKVFVNGKMVDENKEEQSAESVEKKKDLDDHQENLEVNELMKKKSAYDIKDPEFDDVISDDTSFQFIPGKGRKNRAPRLSDRTNFTERITVTEDNNLSGIKGVGVQDIINKTEKKSLEMHDRTDKMLSDIHKGFGKSGGITYDNALMDLMKEFDMDLPRPQPVVKQTKTIEGLDPKTLIIAEAISNPKYKIKK